MRIKVSDVKAMFAQRKIWHSVPFMDIEWVHDDGKVIEYPHGEREAFAITGLNNTDFVRMEWDEEELGLMFTPDPATQVKP